jgi:hypothetical protein
MIDHCEYTLLGIVVTEDEKRIEDAYWKTQKKYASWDMDHDPFKRSFYKRIMSAAAALYKPGNKRQAIIQEHLDACAATVQSLCLPPVLQQGATEISPEGHECMIAMATDEYGPYHLDEALAKRVIDEVLAKFGISISSIPPANPVENLQITYEKDGLKLTWENPKERCDEVKIVRREDRFPENDDDGGIVYTGSDIEFTDKNIEARVTYYYSVFFIYQGRASSKISGLVLIAQNRLWVPNKKW